MAAAEAVGPSQPPSALTESLQQLRIHARDGTVTSQTIAETERYLRRLDEYVIPRIRGPADLTTLLLVDLPLPGEYPAAYLPIMNVVMRQIIKQSESKEQLDYDPALLSPLLWLKHGYVSAMFRRFFEIDASWRQTEDVTTAILNGMVILLNRIGPVFEQGDVDAWLETFLTAAKDVAVRDNKRVDWDRVIQALPRATARNVIDMLSVWSLTPEQSEIWQALTSSSSAAFAADRSSSSFANAADRATADVATLFGRFQQGSLTSEEYVESMYAILRPIMTRQDGLIDQSALLALLPPATSTAALFLADTLREMYDMMLRGWLLFQPALDNINRDITESDVKLNIDTYLYDPASARLFSYVVATSEMDGNEFFYMISDLLEAIGRTHHVSRQVLDRLFVALLGMASMVLSRAKLPALDLIRLEARLNDIYGPTVYPELLPMFFEAVQAVLATEERERALQRAGQAVRQRVLARRRISLPLYPADPASPSRSSALLLPALSLPPPPPPVRRRRLSRALPATSPFQDTGISSSSSQVVANRRLLPADSSNQQLQQILLRQEEQENAALAANSVFSPSVLQINRQRYLERCRRFTSSCSNKRNLKEVPWCQVPQTAWWGPVGNYRHCYDLRELMQHFARQVVTVPGIRVGQPPSYPLTRVVVPPALLRVMVQRARNNNLPVPWQLDVYLAGLSYAQQQQQPAANAASIDPYQQIAEVMQLEVQEAEGVADSDVDEGDEGDENYLEDIAAAVDAVAEGSDVELLPAVELASEVEQ